MEWGLFQSLANYEFRQIVQEILRLLAEVT
jgi:hypothetical protein